MEFMLDKYLVKLEWEQVFKDGRTGAFWEKQLEKHNIGTWQIVFKRYYHGEGEPVTYVFDNRSFHDPFWRGHQITVRNIARQIWWGCTGYQVNNDNLQFLRDQIADFVMTRLFDTGLTGVTNQPTGDKNDRWKQGLLGRYSGT